MQINKLQFSYLLIFISFIFAIQFNFISLFFMMILVYSLVKKLNNFFLNYSEKFRFHKLMTKIFSMLIIAILMFLILIGLNECFIFFKSNYDMILDKLGSLFNDFVSILPFDIKKIITLDNDFSKNIINLLSNQHENIFNLTINAFHFISNCVIGIFLGVILSFNHIDNKVIDNNKKLNEIKNRIDILLDIFEKIFLGQGKISLINTAFTGIYLYAILPTFGYYIPYSEYLLFLTFIFGLLPIIGNLISNILILIFSISLGFKVAISSLIFLILIHKVEYYINGLILGKKININLFETILAMVIFEGVFGFTGLFIGTLIYGYIKTELKNLQLI